MPSQIAPNVWLLTTPLSALTNTISVICPGKAATCIKVEKPVHILTVLTACSATSSTFHLFPRYQTPHIKINISLDIANLHMTNISLLDFHIWQHLRDHRNETQLQHLPTIPSIPMNKIYQHMFNGIQHITPFNTADESTEDTDRLDLDIVPICRNICYGYRITYTSRIGNILLLFLLLLTCQISMPTFTTS